MTIVDKLRTIALKLQWAKPLAFALAAASLALVAYIILGNTGIAANDQYLFPSVILLLWSLSLGGFTQTFVHVPEPPNKEQGFFKRLGLGFKRLYYYFLALAFFGLSIAVIFASLRAFRIWGG